MNKGSTVIIGICLALFAALSVGVDLRGRRRWRGLEGERWSQFDEVVMWGGVSGVAFGLAIAAQSIV